MTNSGAINDEATRLLLDIWHPDCWMLQVTEDLSGGLLGHSVHEVEGMARGRFTAYAESTEALEDFVAAIQASQLTEAVVSIPPTFEFDEHSVIPGYTTRGLVVTYELANSIHERLVSRGFIPDAPVRVYGGREHWPVIVTTGDRDEVQRCLHEIRRECGAEIEVVHVYSTREQPGNGTFLNDTLSDRQREVFDLARTRGYYSWPRQVSASDLAAELDVSESTLLEHLRKAEAKLFDLEP